MVALFEGEPYQIGQAVEIIGVGSKTAHTARLVERPLLRPPFPCPIHSLATGPAFP
jgi:hypothetical protein